MHFTNYHFQVYKHEGKRLRPELRCHAILCKKKGEAAALQEALQNSLHQALQVRYWIGLGWIMVDGSFDIHWILQEYRREKMAHQKARASSLTGTCPRRKLMLQVLPASFRGDFRDLSVSAHQSINRYSDWIPTLPSSRLPVPQRPTTRINR